MKLKAKIVFVFLVLSLFAGNAFTQELTKEEKRALKKEVRNLLKESNNLIDANNLDSAIIVLDSLLIIEPDNPDAYFNKGWIILQKGDSTAAVTVLNEAVAKAPLSTRVRILLSRVQIETGDINNAVINIDEILRVKPNEGEALYLKGLTLLAQEDRAAALEYFKKAADIALDKGGK